METQRELKIKYIDDKMSKRLPIYSGSYLYRSDFLANNSDLVTDICERMEDGNTDYSSFFESWKDKCYDYIIGKIDWDKLNQCEYCGKYFNYMASDSQDQRYCSEECLECYTDNR